MPAACRVRFNLINISNREFLGVADGIGPHANLMNQYNVRFESIDGSPLNQQDVLGLYVSWAGVTKESAPSGAKICWEAKKPYSLAQGQ